MEAGMGRPRELTRDERAELLAKGFRPVEIWLPDLSNPQHREQAIAEAKRIAHADSEENIFDWLDLIQKDMWEGEDQI
jgi:hypothetical protein